MNPAETARNAIEWHKQQEARGESPWSCRLYDGEDNGPPERRCWLQPGHQCDCMTEAEVRQIAWEDQPAMWHLQPPPPSPNRTPTHARHGGQRGDKAARKRQRKARKEQRK